MEYLTGTSNELVGRSILYNWESFGWCLGKVTERNTDSMRQIDGDVVNYLVYYAVDNDTSEHNLQLGHYGGDDYGSWVLLEPMEVPAVTRVSGTKTDDHTIGYDTWGRYKTYEARLKAWAASSGNDIQFKNGTIDGKCVKYPMLLDAAGEPVITMGNAFLIWLKDQPGLPKKQPIKFALKYLTAAANMERKQRGMPRIAEGVFNSYSEVRVANRDQKRAAGAASTVTCTDQSTRADHLPSFEEKVAMMHLAYDGDSRIHENPLRAVQTGIELLITHTTGVRGEKVRSGTYAHVWPRPYLNLAAGEGITGTVFHNTRKGKTNDEGEASHAGWLPSKNPLFDIDGGLGTCLLYRFSRGEQFPSVCADLDGMSPGYQYKWLPLIKSTDGSYPLDTAKALLPIRPIGTKPQNAAWNMLFNAAGVDMYKGDSLTHGGRAASNQEFREAGGDPRVSDEALGYTHDVSKDHYAPHIPLQFGLQRTQYGLLSPDNFTEADAAHIRAGRRVAVELLRKLVDVAVPELPREEAIVEAINTTAGDAYSRKSVMLQKAANVETHKREHQNFLAIVRHQLSMAILNAASRPRKRDGTIDYESPSLIEKHGSSPVYRAIRIRTDGSWLFDHPLFAQITAAVKTEEERERSIFVASDSRQKTASTAATMIVGALSGQLDRMEKKMDANASSISDTATVAIAAANASTAAVTAATAAMSTAEAVRVTAKEAEAHETYRHLCELRPGDSGYLSANEKDQMLTIAAAGTVSIFSALGVVSPPPPPLPPASLAQSVRSEAQTVVAAAPIDAVTPIAVASRKRKRRDDGPGLLHSDLTTLGSIEGLWTEYAGPGGLNQREKQNPKWKGEGPENKRSRQLWTDKMFFYREVARRARELGNVQVAIAAVQQRLNSHKKKGQGGWQKLLGELEREQPKGQVRDDLTTLLKDME